MTTSSDQRQPPSSPSESRQATDSGGKVLRAVRDYLLQDVNAPAWMREEFVRRYALVGDAKVKSWDDAFGRPFPPGTRLTSLQRKRRYMDAAHEAVWAVLRENPRQAIDARLFQKAAERAKVAMSASSLKVRYYQAIKTGEFLNLATWAAAMRQPVSSDPLAAARGLALPVFAIERLNGFSSGSDRT